VNVGSVKPINHVVFMLQENRTFDTYFGMLNPYRQSHSTGGQLWDTGDDGNTYTVDGIDDKLDTMNESDQGDEIPLFKFASSCIDDDSSAWLSSYGDANRYDFATDRKIKMDGFVHTAQGFANSCLLSGTCSGDFTDTAGKRAMGYYDEDFLNYYYYMAAQFAVSDRWFSPIASKSTPNRIATYTGGTTQGLVYDPGYNDHVGGVNAKSIFQVLDNAGVSWKVYYTLTQGQCSDPEDCTGGASSYPATDLGYVFYPDKYIYQNPTGAACTAPTVSSSHVGDPTNYYCIDPTHVAPLSSYYADVANGTLPSFSFIESGYGLNDEHPGSFQPILLGQAQVAKVVNALMNSPSWNDSVFFFSYDEGGGPYDHVPPIPGHSNDFTDKSMGTIPDIKSISVSPDAYGPCLPPAGSKATHHCDLRASDPGAHPGDVPISQSFGAQIGFRVPNIVISPFARKHYVSHIPMDHTAIIKFVESRFISPNAHLTARDAVQPDLLDFFDFTAAPWASAPTPPTPATDKTIGHKTCLPAAVGP
jgi:phospholipase C